jgi:ribulose-phosphate 3-epimerase
LSNLKKTLIAPSILSANFALLGQEVKNIEEAGADLLHIDVMDGNFVPNITFGPKLISDIRKITNLYFDVHLMINKPENYINQFCEAGSDSITFHIEATDQPMEVIKLIKNKGKKVGITLKPSTNIDLIKEFLPLVDVILVMTVEPGFGGQAFMSEQLQKITQLKEYIISNKLKASIEVDGGINDKTASISIQAGADILVAGSYIFSSGPFFYSEKIASLRGK